MSRTLEDDDVQVARRRSRRLDLITFLRALFSCALFFASLETPRLREKRLAATPTRRSDKNISFNVFVAATVLSSSLCDTRRAPFPFTPMSIRKPNFTLYPAGTYLPSQWLCVLPCYPLLFSLSTKGFIQRVPNQIRSDTLNSDVTAENSLISHHY